MSLLMDALKKAEQAKQQGPAPDGPSLGIEPMEVPAPAAEPADASLPELPLKLEELDAEFIAHARAAPPSRPPVERRTQAPIRPSTPPPQPQPKTTADPGRAAVRNAFAVKEPPPAVNRSFAIAVGVATLLAIAAIGGYFWWQLRPASALVRPPMAQPAAPAVLAAPAAVATPEAPGAIAQVATAEASPQATAIAPRPARKATPRAAVATPVADRPIRVATGHLTVPPHLQQGYESFQAGDLAAATAAYRRILDSEPRNIDALRGMAAIALREGRPGEAETYYLRAIEADPRDGAALAGLMGLKGQGDPVASESRLKTLIATQPELPVLHFALGNLYARQSRWNEAQQAYFKAMTGDPENADFLFNLAVSLDQLHQAPLAAQYYEKALAAAATHPGGFARSQAEARLRELRP